MIYENNVYFMYDNKYCYGDSLKLSNQYMAVCFFTATHGIMMFIVLVLVKVITNYTSFI